MYRLHLFGHCISKHIRVECFDKRRGKELSVQDSRRSPLFGENPRGSPLWIGTGVRPQHSVSFLEVTPFWPLYIEIYTGWMF